MKALKRDRGIPSWGGPVRSVTGAGGLLDRVDGLGAVSILATLTFLSVPGLPALLGF